MSRIKLFGILAFVMATSFSFAQKAKNVKVYVKPYKVACSDQSNQQCLQVKFCDEKTWQPLSTTIKGFDYVPGYDYKLKVVQTESSGQPLYELKKVVSKKVAPLMNVYNKKLMLTKINGKDVSTGGVYATIDPATQNIFGYSGCNRFNVSYDQDKKGNINIYSGMGTLMACEQSKMNLELEFLAAFQNQKFKIAENGNDVIFTNQKTKQEVVFTIPTEKSIWSYIDDKEWKLIQLDNVGKNFGNAFIQFNVAEKRVSGNTGCNRFFGTYESSGENIAFKQIGLTRMMCSDPGVMETENKILQYLNSTDLRFDVADQTLNIYKGNKLVMMFAKQ